MKASVIIPTYRRRDLLDSAVGSVLNCQGSESVEILVVDDGSPNPISSPNLRDQDRILRLEENVGPSIARNRGLDVAKGEMIYFLDSDDHFMERDFEADYRNYSGEKALFYCEIDSNDFHSDYPDELKADSYLADIFFRYPHIGQTSSLCFPASLNLRFDESLPRHEDWDMVYNQVLKKGIPMKKIEGRIFFDRSDRKSLSRQSDGSKSVPWVEKIVNQETENPDFDRDQFEFHVLGRYPNFYPWRNYIKNGPRLLFSGRTSLRCFAVRGIHRVMAGLRAI